MPTAGTTTATPANITTTTDIPRISIQTAFARMTSKIKQIIHHRAAPAARQSQATRQKARRAVQQHKKIVLLTPKAKQKVYLNLPKKKEHRNTVAFSYMPVLLLRFFLYLPQWRFLITLLGMQLS